MAAGSAPASKARWRSKRSRPFFRWKSARSFVPSSSSSRNVVISALAAPPTGVDGEGPVHRAAHREVLAGVGLDLESEPDHRRDLGLEPVDEPHALALLPLRLAEPTVEPRAEAIDRRLRRDRAQLNEIDVVGVAPWRREMQLVERCPAAQRDRARELGVFEDGDERPRENEILLDLLVGRPARLRAPLGDEVGWDHASTSIVVFTSTRQRASRSETSSELLGSSRTNLGLRRSTNLPSSPVSSAWPVRSSR